MAVLEGIYPPAGQLEDEEVENLAGDSQRLDLLLVDCIKSGANRIHQIYLRFPEISLREIPFQDAVYMCIKDAMRHDRITVRIETTITNGKKRIDIFITINGTERRISVVIEVKMLKTGQFQQKSEKLYSRLKYCT